MERIFKILWGTGLTTLGLAALIYSKQETPSPSGLLLADGIISDISTNRGHYKFRITDHAGRFAYTNMGFCENLGGLRKQAAVSLLYAPLQTKDRPTLFARLYRLTAKKAPSALTVRPSAAKSGSARLLPYWDGYSCRWQDWRLSGPSCTRTRPLPTTT